MKSRILSVLKKTKNETKKSADTEDIREICEDKRGNTVWNVGDIVKVCYFVKKTWKHYIGIIETKDNLRHIYSITFYKTIKKDGLKFDKNRRKDKDEVPYANIVKKIRLIQIKPDMYILEEDEDKDHF
ncbi:Uncharacterized protein OBRU01_19992 [Operophtera brumata]|uniref:Uncharacterized protein n=1 Tax=Operophtera brumata TaxID=104452 RepID=A0A0L7KW80_OPEBR|nr:Uncharacterized protein OBRU01_19992 [Operophtera brumata]